MTRNQNHAEGFWPGRFSVDMRRDPSSSDIGRFASDAATGCAVLALTGSRRLSSRSGRTRLLRTGNRHHCRASARAASVLPGPCASPNTLERRALAQPKAGARKRFCRSAVDAHADTSQTPCSRAASTAAVRKPPHQSSTFRGWQPEIGDAGHVRGERETKCLTSSPRSPGRNSACRAEGEVHEIRGRTPASRAVTAVVGEGWEPQPGRKVFRSQRRRRPSARKR